MKAGASTVVPLARDRFAKGLEVFGWRTQGNGSRLEDKTASGVNRRPGNQKDEDDQGM
jgi:hypothetical protein